jgi:polyisoprenyl-phosphate glycosyltransferase
MPFLSIISPCYNEEENVEILHTQIIQVMSNFKEYEFEHIYIDNCSTDNTLKILCEMAKEDSRVKVIENARNFGPVRSSSYGLLQCYGDAVVSMASDLQDPPALISDFIKKWEEGYKVVMAVKTNSEENKIVYGLRTLYYKTLTLFSEVKLVENYTGFGLYDRKVIDVLRKLDDPYPYFRGLIADIGFPAAKIEFTQPLRKHGISKNNFYTLYDLAMLGLTSYSKVPLRLATALGFLVAAASFLVGLFYFIYKLINWQNFSLGLAPVVVGLFFFGAVQMLFLGIIGEYIGAIYTQVLHRPPVIEKERINFDD